MFGISAGRTQIAGGDSDVRAGTAGSGRITLKIASSRICCLTGTAEGQAHLGLSPRGPTCGFSRMVASG